MKSRFIYATLVAVLLCTGATYAQDNIIKINLAALVFTNFSLQDEYSLNSNSSVALGVSFLPSRGLPSAFTKKDKTGNISDIKFGGFSITPEYRYYVSGNGPHGFYVAGYFRYAKYTMDNFVYNYTDKNNITSHYSLSGDWTVAAAGIMIGSQWKLGEHLVFDWWILGGAFGKNDGTLSGTGALSSQNETDISNSLATMKVPVGTIKSTVTANSVSATYDPGIPALRGFGLCLGYNFGN